MARPSRSERGGHSSWIGIAPGLAQPTRMAGPEMPGVAPAPSLFGFAPGGVCLAVDVAAGAVGSYPTLSPLPRLGPACPEGLAKRRGGLLSVALSLGSPPPAVSRHRLPVEPGLSSRTAFRRSCVRPPGRLTPPNKGFGQPIATSIAGKSAVQAGLLRGWR